MSTGPRYWNEETQRWEDAEPGTDGRTAPAPGETAAPADVWPAPADAGPDTSAGGQAGPASGGANASGTGATGQAVPGGAGGGPAGGIRPAAAGSGGSAPAVPPPPPHPDPHASHSLPTLTGIQPPPPAPGPGPAPGPASAPAPWPPSEPSYPYPPAVPAPRGDTRRRVWAVVGAAAVAGVAVGLVVTFVVKQNDESGGPARGNGSVAAGTSQTPDGSPDTGTPETPTGSPSALTSEPPAGFESYTDPQGFSIARPTGWTRSVVPSQYGMDVVHYRSPDGEQRLQVFEVAEASPEESHELFLSDAVPKAPGFTELSLENLDDGDVTGSRLEYVVDSIKGEPDVGGWHVVDERFVAADGKVYAIAAYGADTDGRENERALLRTALGAFCPPDTVCGTDSTQP